MQRDSCFIISTGVTLTLGTRNQNSYRGTVNCQVSLRKFLMYLALLETLASLYHYHLRKKERSLIRASANVYSYIRIFVYSDSCILIIRCTSGKRKEHGVLLSYIWYICYWYTSDEFMWRRTMTTWDGLETRQQGRLGPDPCRCDGSKASGPRLPQSLTMLYSSPSVETSTTKYSVKRLINEALYVIWSLDLRQMSLPSRRCLYCHGTRGGWWTWSWPYGLDTFHRNPRWGNGCWTNPSPSLRACRQRGAHHLKHRTSSWTLFRLVRAHSDSGAHAALPSKSRERKASWKKRYQEDQGSKLVLTRI